MDSINTARELCVYQVELFSSGLLGATDLLR